MLSLLLWESAAPTFIGLNSEGLRSHDNREREAVFALETGNSRVTIVEGFHEARDLPVVRFKAWSYCSVKS